MRLHYLLCSNYFCQYSMKRELELRREFGKEIFRPAVLHLLVILAALFCHYFSVH